MNVLVLGRGRQGKAVVYDLIQGDDVGAVTCADADVDGLSAYLDGLDGNKARAVSLDASDRVSLGKLVGGGFDVVIDMLPRQFVRSVAEAAIDAGVHLVNTYYDHELRDLDDRAREAGIAILPEMGMDPGIDLVLCAEAVRRLDEVHVLLSYGGGIPEPSAAADNPLKYKISWTWEGVLNSYSRPARVLRDGRAVSIPASEIFEEQACHTIDVPDLGRLEAFPNGDAVQYVRKLGVADALKTAGRYALRWPGHRRLWKALVDLGFLEETPVPGLSGNTSPRAFIVKHLEPRLQYKAHQRDVVVVRVQAEGIRDGQRRRLALDLVDYKDTATGLMAMSRTVGFPASIAAQMIARGMIAERGLLSPALHMPYTPFVDELARRNIVVQEEEAEL